MKTLGNDTAGLAVERVFLVLEGFGRFNRPMNLTEIARSLNSPKSSMLKLLRGMTELGYLTEDESTKTYFPSPKVSNLGSDVESLLVGHHETIVMLEDLRDATGESVSMAIQNGVEVSFFNSLLGTKQLALNVNDGASYPIYVSAAGRAILAQLEPAELKKITNRIKTIADATWPVFDVKKLMENVVEIRATGYAKTHPDASTDVISVAKLIPLQTGPRPVAVSVGGARQYMLEKEAEIVSTIDEVFACYYG